MKFSDLFSPEAVNKRSAQATKELDAAARSAKVKRELDNAQMEKKERRPLKEFIDLRMELNEGVEEIEENFIPHSSMPPNILILRRKTVRQFPNNVMVALYYNDKLGQYFSIPYGGEASDDPAVITPVSLKEEELTEIFYDKDNRKSLDIDGHSRAQWMDKFEKHVTHEVPMHAGKIRWDHAHHYHMQGLSPSDAAMKYVRSNPPLKEDADKSRKGVKEDAISHLQKVKAFATDKPLYHKDGSQTKVDPTTANALLTVHGSLEPHNQKRMADALEHSQAKFHRMLDYAWSKVAE